jgi:hypothetical protein
MSNQPQPPESCPDGGTLVEGLVLGLAVAEEGLAEGDIDGVAVDVGVGDGDGDARAGVRLGLVTTPAGLACTRRVLAWAGPPATTKAAAAQHVRARAIHVATERVDIGISRRRSP